MCTGVLKPTGVSIRKEKRTGERYARCFDNFLPTTTGLARWTRLGGGMSLIPRSAAHRLTRLAVFQVCVIWNMDAQFFEFCVTTLNGLHMIAQAYGLGIPFHTVLIEIYGEISLSQLILHNHTISEIAARLLSIQEFDATQVRFT